jgi:acetylornithine deacetylase/succinyl-diaminopimelate desuccinylase-like protein
VRTPQATSLTQLVEQQRDEVVSTLTELAAIPALGMTGEGYPEIAALLAQKMTEAGLKVQTIEIPADYLHQLWGTDLQKTVEYIPVRKFAGRKIVFGKRTSSGTRPSLHLNQHYDIQRRHAAAFSDTTVATSSDRVSAPGVSFCRAGIVSMLAAVKAITLADTHLGGELFVSFTPDCHLGGEAGAGYLVQQGLGKSELVITGSEGGPDAVVLGYKGALWLKITTHGVSTAGSAPHRGINAIDKMLEIQNALRRLDDKRNSPWPMLPREAAGPTLVFSQISSSGWGVPDKCVMLVDRRVLPEETVASAAEEITQVIRSLQGSDKQLKVDIAIVHAVEPAVTDSSAPLAATLERNVREILGVEPYFAVHAYYTDFRLFRNDWAAQTVNYGPGRRERIEGEPEHVLIADVLATAKVLAHTIRDVLPR